MSNFGRSKWVLCKNKYSTSCSAWGARAPSSWQLSASTLWSYGASASRGGEQRLGGLLSRGGLHVSGKPVLVRGRVPRASDGPRMHWAETWTEWWWKCRSTTVRHVSKRASEGLFLTSRAALRLSGAVCACSAFCGAFNATAALRALCMLRLSSVWSVAAGREKSGLLPSVKQDQGPSTRTQYSHM